MLFFVFIILICLQLKITLMPNGIFGSGIFWSPIQAEWEPKSYCSVAVPLSVQILASHTHRR